MTDDVTGMTESYTQIPTKNFERTNTETIELISIEPQSTSSDTTVMYPDATSPIFGTTGVTSLTNIVTSSNIIKTSVTSKSITYLDLSTTNDIHTTSIGATTNSGYTTRLDPTTTLMRKCVAVDIGVSSVIVLGV